MGEQQPPMYGGYGYGHSGMMPHPGHHMGHGHGHGHSHGHGHGHGMGGMGRGGGGDSRVPFRAGDWRCGADGCNYHNFAKNVSCLRCGASRASAAISVGDEGHGHYGMGHPPSMGGTPGPGHYGAAPGGYGSGGGYPGQGYGGPPSTYALPSGLGAAASPYPPMGSGYGGHNGGMQSGGFDSRAESAFSSGGHQGGAGGYSNGGHAYGGGENAPDPFNFLSTGLGNLSMGGDDGRRNGGNTSKSPA